jgi:predicted outer membrane repeat protein
MGTATLVLLTLLAFSLTPPSPSYAATLTVCASCGGYTTIAAAIAAASAGDTISITDAVRNEANLTVSKNLTIQGQGANTAVDGTGISGSVFTINAGVTATIQDITIRNGSVFFGGGSGTGGGIFNHGTVTISNSTLSGNSATIGGGGIFNDGTVTISNSTLSGNSATGGGGIFNRGTVTLSNSTLSGNFATSHGGGISNYVGTVTLSNSTLSDNSATYFGGGIYNYGGGIFNGSTVTISNSTLSGNSTTSTTYYGYGGGIFNRGTVALSNSTLSGNSATSFGGGIYSSGTTTVKNSIVANSSGTDCYGTPTALGANLDTDGSCGTTKFTAVTPSQLSLGPLALNAPGTTKTQALLPPSAAINAAPDCTDFSSHPVTTDQRGVARPDNGESACDIGAFELVDRKFHRKA